MKIPPEIPNSKGSNRKIVYNQCIWFQDPSKHPEGLVGPCCFQTLSVKGNNMMLKQINYPNMLKK